MADSLYTNPKDGNRSITDQNGRCCFTCSYFDDTDSVPVCTCPTGEFWDIDEEDVTTFVCESWEEYNE